MTGFRLEQHNMCSASQSIRNARRPDIPHNNFTSTSRTIIDDVNVSAITRAKAAPPAGWYLTRSHSAGLTNEFFLYHVSVNDRRNWWRL